MLLRALHAISTWLPMDPCREEVMTLADLRPSSRAPVNPSAAYLSLVLHYNPRLRPVTPQRGGDDAMPLPCHPPRREEVMTLADLRHPNVMQFFGAVMKPPHLCMVTEHMPFSLHHVLYQVRARWGPCGLAGGVG